MIQECISRLRQRMIEDMSSRHFGEKTQKDYIRAVKNLTMFLGRSPDTATAEDLRLFQLHLTESRVRPPTIAPAGTPPTTSRGFLGGFRTPAPAPVDREYAILALDKIEVGSIFIGQFVRRFSA
jgi:hypothetical protein